MALTDNLQRAPALVSLLGGRHRFGSLQASHHLEFAVKCGYLQTATARELYATYHRIPTASRGEPRRLVTMIRNPKHWLIGQ